MLQRIVGQGLCIFSQVKDAVALYNALNLGVVFLDLLSFSQLNEHFRDGGTIDTQSENYNSLMSLVKLGLLVDETADEMAQYDKWKSVLESLPVGVLYLLVTDACNLECPRCAILGSIPKGQKRVLTTREIAKRSIDLYARVLRERQKEAEGLEYHLVSNEPQIILYGGEPFLNLEVVRFVLEYVAQLKAGDEIPDSVGITINTNATRANEDIARLLAQHDVHVSVSIDGVQATHDEGRPYPDGKGSYEDTVCGFMILKDAGVSVSISCTLNQPLLELAPDLPKLFLEKFGIYGFGFNILIDSESYKVEDIEQYAQRASRALLASFRKVRDIGVYEDRIMRKAKAFAEGRIYLNDCAGCGQQIVVSPTGKLGVCQAYTGTEKFFVDYQPDFDPISHPYWKEWRMRSPLNMSECIDCPALGICGGGCLHDADLRAGSIWQLDRAFCVHAKMTLDFLIRDLWEQMNQ